MAHEQAGCETGLELSLLHVLDSQPPNLQVVHFNKELR